MPGQGDGAALGVGLLAIEECGVADGAEADAAAFVGDLGAQGGAFVTFGAEKPELHELVGAEEFLQLGEELGREAAAPEFERGLEALAEAAEVGALGAG